MGKQWCLETGSSSSDGSHGRIDASHFRRLVFLGVPLVAVVVLFAHDSPPAALAQQQTPSYAQAVVWSGTLTVEAKQGGGLGCGTQGRRDDIINTCSTRFSPGSTFSHAGTSYEIVSVTLGGGTLYLHTEPALPADWAPVVGDIWLSVRDEYLSVPFSNTNTNGKIVGWRRTGLSWTAESEVSLSLVVPSASVPTVSLSVAPNPVLEGDPVTVTAALSSPLSSAVTIPVYLENLTAENDDRGPCRPSSSTPVQPAALGSSPRRRTAMPAAPLAARLPRPVKTRSSTWGCVPTCRRECARAI